MAAAHRPPGRHLTTGHRPDDRKGEQSRARGTRRPRNVTRRPTPTASGTFRANRHNDHRAKAADGSRSKSKEAPPEYIWRGFFGLEEPNLTYSAAIADALGNNFTNTVP